MTQNRYIDTRGLVETPVAFTQAVVEGLAPAGGLYVPEHIPQLSLEEILVLADLPYAQRAAYIYQTFDVDLPKETVESLMAQSYGQSFDTEDICPTVSLDSSTHILELWHGPTSAFKDMALQCLPHFFSESVRRLKEVGALDTDFLILTATSGDTGKAALEGFRDVDHVRIAVLYPHGGVSDIQYKQMATQKGGNVMVWGVRGNFDDCQTAVKTVFGDTSFAELLKREHGVALSSANSINWGRLLPQIVYYVASYASLVRSGKVEPGEPIDVCVPTGNFGNILAAWYAKQMGTPIGKLICASNENCVLTDFIRTGSYDISDRGFILTPSPSMDILVSSNLERQLFELSGRRGEAVRTWMQDLKTRRSFRIDPETFAKVQDTFCAGFANSGECFAAINEVFRAHHYLLDPHTAVAYHVAQRARGSNQLLIASTAHWAKFGSSVYRALHGLAPQDPLPESAAALTGCQLNELVAQETQTHNIPTNLANLDATDIRFTDIIDNASTGIEQAIISFLTQS